MDMRIYSAARRGSRSLVGDDRFRAVVVILGQASLIPSPSITGQASAGRGVHFQLYGVFRQLSKRCSLQHATGYSMPESASTRMSSAVATRFFTSSDEMSHTLAAQEVRSKARLFFALSSSWIKPPEHSLIATFTGWRTCALR